LEESSEHVLTGDYNMRVSGRSGCSSGVNNASQVTVDLNTRIADTEWTNNVHGLSGNLALADGSAHQTTSEDLQLFIGKGDDNGSVHLLLSTKN